MKLWKLYVLILLLPACSTNNNNGEGVSSGYDANKPYLVVLSMDAFRLDYPAKYQPKQGELNAVLDALKDVAHVKAYTKETMPEAFHYTNSDRIFDVVCVADSAWSIYWNASSYSTGGTHGYAPANPNMHAIFYASGPAFKKNYVQPTFRNIHLYNLFAGILGLNPAQTDGSLTEVEGMLSKD